MRFRAGIQNINVFSKLTSSLSSLGNVAWVRLSDHDARFTVVPEQGSQVWAVLQIDTIFDETFTIQSAAPENSINLEVPLQPLFRALRSAQNAAGASIRLTKKDNVPLLSMTITTPVLSGPGSTSTYDPHGTGSNFDGDGYDPSPSFQEEPLSARDTVITQDIPVRVLAPASVQGLHEPVCREPDVHIMLPSLMQLKSISDRFTKLALSSSSAKAAGGFKGSAARAQKLELSANMHGCLRLGLDAEGMKVSSTWTGLNNPELDPGSVDGGVEGVREHPSTRMKRYGDAEGISDEGWATVRVDGRDWGRVLGVGRLGGRVIACFCHENALILYVYLANDHEETESVLTYYVSSYSA
ncbi:checkpoint protein Hus1/Mec3 [Elsinoe ampelina]|uniref:Checkpoint protein n=1 Tax=Elsinoe ampelina TaxID=302913 RepID=A0A6A6FZV6_9PEZI|nr:checkpoint protein Hus1/Mec3 [Elsinoe ampelina]